MKKAITEHSDVEFDVLCAGDCREYGGGGAGASSYAPSHPMFGPMTPEDWMRWGYLHADHHLRQFGR